MTAGGDLLLLADGDAGESLRRQLGDTPHTVLEEPYDALEELGRRSWATVVLAGPRPEFAGLCRAARRLQTDARLYAVCPPAGEPDVRKLMGTPLDNYFIHPLDPKDITELRLAAETSAPNQGINGAAAPARQLAELIDAANDPESMDNHLVRVVNSLVGCPVTWVPADRVPAGAKPLLLAAGKSPRVLVPLGTPRRSRTADVYLAFAQECLPSLLTVAQRTSGLHLLSITDYLTGAFNRRYFYEATDRILLRAQAERFRVTCLLYDIDDFKRYNDTYGHAAGDEILRDTAKMMRQITRAQDIVARIGGDEFAVLFWDADKPRSPNSRPPETAYALADRFRKAVHRHAFRSLGPEARGTLSISGGLASYPWDGKSVRELLSRADAALQQAKDSGKNSIRIVGAGQLNG